MGLRVFGQRLPKARRLGQKPKPESSGSGLPVGMPSSSILVFERFLNKSNMYSESSRCMLTFLVFLVVTKWIAEFKIE